MCPTEEQEVMDGRPPFRRAAAFYRGGAVSLFIGGLFGSKRAGTGI